MNPTKTDYQEVFHPRDYLKTYYSEPSHLEDESINVNHLLQTLRKRNSRWNRALEIGCGPTIHHTIPLANHVEEIHLCDYLQCNLDEVQLWITGDQSAHDWTLFIRNALIIEDLPANEEDIADRASLLRSKIKSLNLCDLRDDAPLGDARVFDLVTLFYTAECAARDLDEWRKMVQRISKFVAPGGTLFQVSMRNCDHYLLGSTPIPAVPVNENDLRDAFNEAGFDPRQTSILPVSINAWENHGFDGIVIATGEKRTESGR